MDKQQVLFKDLGIIDYKAAWDYQEELMKANVAIKAEFNTQHSIINPEPVEGQHSTFTTQYSTHTIHDSPLSYDPEPVEGHHSPFTIHHSPLTTHHLLFCEHLPVYTLGKSGSMKNVLLSEQEMDEREIEW